MLLLPVDLPPEGLRDEATNVLLLDGVREAAALEQVPAGDGHAEVAGRREVLQTPNEALEAAGRGRRKYGC